METSKLTGSALDWAVALCEGKMEDCEIHAGNVLYGRVHFGFIHYRPSANWAQGGPIIEEMRGIKMKIGRKPDAPCYAHIVGYDGVERWHQTGQTLLIAAMRCYVASKLGDEVKIPEGVTRTILDSRR